MVEANISHYAVPSICSHLLPCDKQKFQVQHNRKSLRKSTCEGKVTAGGLEARHTSYLPYSFCDGGQIMKK